MFSSYTKLVIILTIITHLNIWFWFRKTRQKLIKFIDLSYTKIGYFIISMNSLYWKFNKRILIEKGDIVIITKPTSTNTKVCINYKLNSDQVLSLISEFKISDRLANLYNNRCTTIDDKEISDLNELTFTED